MSIGAPTYAKIPFLNGDREFFRVDESRYLKEPVDKSWTIAKVVKTPFLLLGAVFTSFIESVYANTSYIKTSFNLTVLGKYGSYYRISVSPWVMSLKVVLWIGQISFNVLSTTARLFFDKLQDTGNNEAYPAAYANEGIDVSHLRSNDIEIDMSEVSEGISLDSLLGIFDDIPACTNARINKEGGTRESLKVFINRVRGRVAFLGTPPAHDAPRLCAFYQQIEDAIRFCLHKAQDQIDGFVGDKNSKEYESLLDDQYRIAINLAVAGESCGARYMGESMELYYRYSGIKDTGVLTLEDTLIELLAEKRLEIAKSEISRIFDPNGQGVDTHDYNNYMSSLGNLLGLPGSKNIIEHLANPLPKAEYLSCFFGEYTPEVIINAVQEKLQSSQAFREKVYAWIKGYAEEYDLPEERVEDHHLKQISEIRERTVREDSPLLVTAQHLKEMVEDLVPLGWDKSFETANEMVQDGRVRAYFREKFSQKESLRIQQEISRLLNILPSELRNVLLNPKSSSRDRFRWLMDETVMRIKAEEICALFDTKIDIKDVFLLLQPNYQEEGLEEGLSKILQKAIESQDKEISFFEEFYSHMYNEDEEKNLLSRELIEWLLVSHHILRPQVVEGGL